MPKQARLEYPIPSQAEFVEKYGEAMSQSRAAALFDLDRSTINRLCTEGALLRTPETRVLTATLYTHMYRNALGREDCRPKKSGEFYTLPPTAAQRVCEVILGALRED